VTTLEMGWGALAPAPNPRDVLRSMGVPYTGDDDILFVSEPVRYNGRLRLFIATRSTMVYARSPDLAQSLANVFNPQEWLLDWAAPVHNLAFLDEGGGDDGSMSLNINGDAKAMFGIGDQKKDAAVLVLHVRARDAWLGDPSSTRMRPVAVAPTQLEPAREALRGIMRDAGRVPALCWAERPTQSTMVVYLKRGVAEQEALTAMVAQVCRDHGLRPESTAARGDEPGVRPASYYAPRHPAHFQPSFIELNGTL
jgi:hypothetical protein